MAMQMTQACHESELRGGEQIPLPLAEDMDLRSEQEALDRMRREYDRDPMDVEAMLAVSFPRP